MSEEELKLSLEILRGELKRLDTVLGMFMAEQRRSNAEVAATFERHLNLVEACESRLDKVHLRLAAYTGGLASLWILFQIVKTFVR